MILICTSFYLCSTNSYFCLSKGLSNAFSWSMSKWNVSERMYWCILVMISQPSLRYVLFRFIKICTVRARNTRTKHNVCLQQDRITLEWIWFYHITPKVNWKWGRGGYNRKQHISALRFNAYSMSIFAKKSGKGEWFYPPPAGFDACVLYQEMAAISKFAT